MYNIKCKYKNVRALSLNAYIDVYKCWTKCTDYITFEKKRERGREGGRGKRESNFDRLYIL